MARGARIEQLASGLLIQAQNCRRWPLYIWGGTGRGKTFAAALVYALWQNPAYWTSLVDLCDTLRGYQSNHTQMIHCASQDLELSHSGFWKKLRTIGLVVVDEIGSSEGKTQRYDAVLRLLDERASRPMILTGNVHPEKLPEIYDERVQSRILAGTLLELGGVDRRVESLADRIKKV